MTFVSAPALCLHNLDLSRLLRWTRPPDEGTKLERFGASPQGFRREIRTAGLQKSRKIWHGVGNRAGGRCRARWRRPQVCSTAAQLVRGCNRVPPQEGVGEDGRIAFTGCTFCCSLLELMILSDHTSVHTLSCQDHQVSPQARPWSMKGAEFFSL